ncbi:MAG: hypothetical protein SGJ18_02745 [Pseudomonadota bacterium]|nr:hypothetical protein [Pseudomonadota bacterium]
MESTLHFRRCHICGQVNENRTLPVEKCKFCGKVMAPFYYFDEAKAEAITDNGMRPEYFGHQFKPLYGLSTYW